MVKAVIAAGEHFQICFLDQLSHWYCICHSSTLHCDIHAKSYHNRRRFFLADRKTTLTEVSVVS